MITNIPSEEERRAYGILAYVTSLERHEIVYNMSYGERRERMRDLEKAITTSLEGEYGTPQR